MWSTTLNLSHIAGLLSCYIYVVVAASKVIGACYGTTEEHKTGRVALELAWLLETSVELEVGALQISALIPMAVDLGESTLDRKAAFAR